MRNSFFKRMGATLRAAFGSVMTLLLSVALTFALFLLLPLIQAISQSDRGSVDSGPTEIVQVEPPPPPPEDEEPEPEPDDSEPPPESFDTDTQLSFDDLNALIDGPVGPGGFGGKNIESLLDSLGGAAGGEDLFSVDELDARPQIKFLSKPRVTPALLRKGGATVVLVFTVDKAGRVRDARISRSTDPAFDSCCLEAIRNCTWEPGRRDDKAVTTRNCRYTFRF